MSQSRVNITSRWAKRALAAGALVVWLLTGGMGVAPPANAATTTPFTVNIASDEGDAFLGDDICDVGSGPGGFCTLRAAIEQANATPGADVINFNIFGDSGGVQTITPLSPLPPITEQVTIDGYTQPGASPNTLAVGDDAVLKVELDGTKMPSGTGLRIEGSSGSVIRGLVINQFPGTGIFIGGNSIGNRIEGNFIGTDPTGTIDEGNGGAGIGAFGTDISQTVVGGTTPAARNVVSGNASTGVELGDTSHDDVPSESMRVQGNYIGTDSSGTEDLGNADGIFVEIASGTMIGGKTAASRNVVSGNGSGVDLDFASGTKMFGNRIGTTANGTGALGNDLFGVFLSGIGDLGSNNVLGDGTSAGSNIVAFNGGDGIVIFTDSHSNELSRNSIFSNGGLGIDLRGPGEDLSTNVPTPNDPGDTDSGPNGLQNKPVLSSTKTISGTTTIKGKLESTPSTLTTTQTFVLRFYSNPPDTNEGKKFIGQKSVTTSVDGLSTFTFTPAKAVAVGKTITATATNASTHDTSEFSAPRQVVSS